MWTGPSQRSNSGLKNIVISSNPIFRFISGLKTDLGSKFDGAGKLAKDEIDMVQNTFTQTIKIYQFFATSKDFVPEIFLFFILGRYMF